ncbi:MAG TPA: hypothetical protein VKT18_06580, partial [Acidimicrobiales bacterium]|nr:hypothetical protein [Acidimicrobiales bacterium]
MKDELERALPAFLERQRWYGGKGRGHAVRVVSVDELRPDLVRAVVDAGGDRYQLLLGVGDDAPDGAAHVAELDDPADLVVYDALGDERLALAVLAIAAPDLHAAHARAVGAEQSNTSVVYDDAYILKLFRRLASPNPDVEVTVALWRTGFRDVAEPLAVWRHDGDDLAVVQRFLPGGADGWDLAVDAARHGRPFTDEAVALGALTAALHAALARAFGTWPATPSEWADAALARVAGAEHDRIDRPAVHAAVERVRGVDDAGIAIRVHGDYHLGQVMRSGGRWYVLDFEGEPTRPLPERRAPSSPLRDVAGMLRSFGYAGGTARRQGADADGVRAWENTTRDAFVRAYFAHAGGLVPRDPAAAWALLTAFEVDKAVYEVAYEQGNR